MNREAVNRRRRQRSRRVADRRGGMRVATTIDDDEVDA